jgi:hypothetical protein
MDSSDIEVCLLVCIIILAIFISIDLYAGIGAIDWFHGLNHPLLIPAIP